MKKIFISCVTAVLSLVMIFSVSAPGAFAKTTKLYAYNNTYWGDSISQVKKITKHYSQDGNNLYVSSSALGYKATVEYTFQKNKLSTVFVFLNLPKKYYTWGQMTYLHDQLYNKLKKSLNTKSDGLTTGYNSYDNISTLWKFKSRYVVLSVYYSSRDNSTIAGILYTPPVK